MSNKTHTIAIFQLLSTAVLWSLGGLLIKLIQWNPIAIAGGRSIIAALMMLAILKRPKLRWDKYLILGALSYSATVILFVMSTKFTTAANAILLQYTAPIYIAILGAWFLKEKTSWLDWTTVFVVLLGMVMFFLDEISSGNFLGNILAILSGITFALISIFLRKQKDKTPMESVFWGNILTAIIALPFMFGAVPDTKSILVLLLSGIFQLGLSYILYSYAIKKVTALESILITVIEPILNPIWVLLAIGEKPSFMAIIGGCIVLIAIVMRNIINNFLIVDVKK